MNGEVNKPFIERMSRRWHRRAKLTDLIGRSEHGKMSYATNITRLGYVSLHTSGDSINRRLSHTVVSRPRSIFGRQFVLKALLLSSWKTYIHPTRMVRSWILDTTVTVAERLWLYSPLGTWRFMSFALFTTAAEFIRCVSALQFYAMYKWYYDKTTNCSSRLTNRVLCLESPSTSTIINHYFI